jgi:hypothetical protein
MKKAKSKKKQPIRPSKRLVATLAILVVGIGLLSLAAYKVMGRNYIAATDSAGIFSFEYPEDWTVEPYVWEDCCHYDTQKSEPDWSKKSKPITLHPHKDKNVEVTINTDKYGDYWKSYEDLKAFVDEDYFAKILFEGKREDSHSALFARVDYLGPPDAKVESFTDNRYYFDNGDSVLRVEFREKYHHDWPDDAARPDVDNTEYLSEFEHIAKSIKFSK